MKHMQEAASRHAEQLGLGHQRLNEINGCWVLSNICMIQDQKTTGDSKKSPHTTEEPAHEEPALCCSPAFRAFRTYSST